MPTDVNYSRTRRSAASISRNATVAIAVVLAVFAILHVIGAALLSDSRPIDDMRSTVHGD
jgi:hypothetical protein